MGWTLGAHAEGSKSIPALGTSENFVFHVLYSMNQSKYKMSHGISWRKLKKNNLIETFGNYKNVCLFFQKLIFFLHKFVRWPHLLNEAYLKFLFLT